MKSEIQKLSCEIAQRQLRIMKLKDAIRFLDVGQYEQYTIYAVKTTTVRKHTRRGYRAVRVVIGKRAGK